MEVGPVSSVTITWSIIGSMIMPVESLEAVEWTSLVSRVWVEHSAFLRILNFLEHSIRLPHQFGDGTLVDRDADLVGDLKMDDLVADFHDSAVDPATRHDTITTLQILQHLAGVALLLLLRANEQEIEDREHRD